MKSNFKRLQFDPFSCWLLALIILVGGCSSTAIKSQRLAPEAEPGNEFGIIYQMIKPQFTISTIEATDTTTPPKYTLNVEFVPDANRRFAVSSHPGTFSDSDLTVNLNSNGAMTGLTHTSREQITPTIKAVGDFAASIIGAAATYAGVRFLGGESERQVAEQMRNELEGRLVCYKNKKVDQLEITPDLYALPASWSKLPEEKKENATDK